MLAFVATGIIITLMGGLVCIGAILLLKIPTYLCTGLLCGAQTSTPGMAAAVEASGGNPLTSIGYGIGYPFGVIGVVLFVQLMPKLTRCDIQAELADLVAVSKRKAAKEAAKPLLTMDPFGLCSFSLAVVLGVLLGGISIPLPGGAHFALGVSGGPLLVGLLAGHFGNVGRVSLKVPEKTLHVLRELGLAFFLLGAGLSAGNGFLAVLKEYGIWLFLIGMIMTILPMIVGYLICNKGFHIPPFTALGAVCGGMTSTPALGSLVAVAGTDDVAASYAATYPVALICIVLLAQFLCVLL